MNKKSFGASTVFVFNFFKNYFKTLKTELPYDPVITLLGIYPKHTKMQFKSIHEPNVYSSIIYNRQNMETAQVSIN